MHTSQVAHQARAYQGFSSMKRLGVFVPPECDATPSSKVAGTYLYTWVERGTVKVSAKTQRSGLELSCLRDGLVNVRATNRIMNTIFWSWSYLLSPGSIPQYSIDFMWKCCLKKTLQRKIQATLLIFVISEANDKNVNM